MRFRWIAKDIEYKDIETLGYTVKVEAILHNRLLQYDNFDKFNWETIQIEMISKMKKPKKKSRRLVKSKILLKKYHRSLKISQVNKIFLLA